MYSASDFPAIIRMRAVTLQELKSVSLMNRIDTKYVTTSAVLQKILEDACECGYRVCEIAGERLLRYSSVYYDTEDLKMFTVHRNGKKTRQKVRVRTYLIDEQTFLEVKKKNNKGRTKKKRIPVNQDSALNLAAEKEAAEFLRNKSMWELSDITPEATTDFGRFTLTDSEMTERITIDIGVSFRNLRNGRNADVADLVILELKQDGKNHSTMKDILLKHRVFPFRISKYCLAVTLTEPSVRPGRYMKKLRYIGKLTKKPL